MISLTGPTLASPTCVAPVGEPPTGMTPAIAAWSDVYAANAARAIGGASTANVEDVGEPWSPSDSDKLFEPQTIDGTGTGPVNIDYYEVRFNAPPGVSLEAFFGEFRKNASERIFGGLKPEGYELRPFNDRFGHRWQSDDLSVVYGTAMTFSLGPTTAGVDSETATVICSCASKTDWVFSTVATEKDGIHPVSGSRAFGIRDLGDGTWALFTKGTDRVSDPQKLRASQLQEDIMIGLAGLAPEVLLDFAPIIWNNLAANLESEFSNLEPQTWSVARTVPYQEYYRAMNPGMPGYAPVPRFSDDIVETPPFEWRSDNPSMAGQKETGFLYRITPRPRSYEETVKVIDEIRAAQESLLAEAEAQKLIDDAEREATLARARQQSDDAARSIGQSSREAEAILAAEQNRTRVAGEQNQEQADDAARRSAAAQESSQQFVTDSTEALRSAESKNVDFLEQARESQRREPSRDANALNGNDGRSASMIGVAGVSTSRPATSGGFKLAPKAVIVQEEDIEPVSGLSGGFVLETHQVPSSLWEEGDDASEDDSADADEATESASDFEKTKTSEKSATSGEPGPNIRALLGDCARKFRSCIQNDELKGRDEGTVVTYVDSRDYEVINSEIGIARELPRQRVRIKECQSELGCEQKD
ncbi:MAG: hypothetical protein R3245_05055 [Kiloniellales bacterium]|nr:hypothetical protein [Kiloniellales bacterium]